MLAARLPEDDCQQIDTTALPVKHTSRVRGPDGWTGPGNDLSARFGRDAAHAEWFYGFRLAAERVVVDREGAVGGHVGAAAAAGHGEHRDGRLRRLKPESYA